MAEPHLLRCCRAAAPDARAGDLPGTRRGGKHDVVDPDGKPSSHRPDMARLHALVYQRSRGLNNRALNFPSGQGAQRKEPMTRAKGLESRSEILEPTTTAPADHWSLAREGPFALARSEPRNISPRRIGLFGVFGCGNTGNDGSLEAMLLFLRRVRPDAKFACFCSPRYEAAEQVERDFGLFAIPYGIPEPSNPLLRSLDLLTLQAPRKLSSFVRAIWHMRKLDLLIVSGGGFLEGFGTSLYGRPLTIFAWCLAGRLCRTRVAFVSVGAGSIGHPISRWLLKSAVAPAHYRSYRDRISKAFMESIGCDTRSDPVYPDIAFNLPEPSRSHRHETEDGPLTVGVGVMAFHGWRKDRASADAVYAAYVEKITIFVLWLIDRGHRVRILMGETADWQAATDVVAKVAIARPNLPPGRLLAEQSDTIHEVMRQVAEVDVVVATRFHNVVCALKLDKPTLSIGYGAKNDALMAEMGLGRFCQHIEHLDLDLLVDQFTDLISDRGSYEQSIRDANLVIQERLERQGSILASHLL
jgi:polysaccharide pyruvyl transferase WcaK-like protein